MPSCKHISHHSLRVANIVCSIAFYQQKLGFTVIAKKIIQGRLHAWLGFIGLDRQQSYEPAYPISPVCYLELIEVPDYLTIENKRQAGYWKIAISVQDLDVARLNLVDNQVDVGQAFEVVDVGYLCHFEDPDGYCIELIQHEFKKNHEPRQVNPDFHLGTAASFLLITYRIANPEASLYFYRDLLGMKLLSRQRVEAFGFTLYFLACTGESPPIDDIEAVGIREWLWQRPYTMIELQHIWRADDDPFSRYDTSKNTGFESLSIIADDVGQLRQTVSTAGYAVGPREIDPILSIAATTFIDPDGYRIRVIDTENQSQ